MVYRGAKKKAWVEDEYGKCLNFTNHFCAAPLSCGRHEHNFVEKQYKYEFIERIQAR